VALDPGVVVAGEPALWHVVLVVFFDVVSKRQSVSGTTLLPGEEEKC
jgi:hypothetical protein